MKTKTSSSAQNTFFFIGFILVSLFFSKIVLDVTLTPRYLLLSLFLSIYLIYFLLFFKKKEILFDPLILIFFIFTLLCALSSFWSYNKALSIVESSKMFLFFVYFLLSLSLLRFNEMDFLKKLIKSIFIIFIISLIPFFLDAYSLNYFSHENIYNISSISGHKNLYSIFLFLCMVFSFIGLFIFQKKWRIYIVSLIILQLSLIIFLESRTVYITLVFSLLVFATLFFFKNKIGITNIKSITFSALIFLIFLNVFSYLILPQLIDLFIEKKPSHYNLENITDLSTFYERLFIWKKTYPIIYDNFLFGVGANNWQVVLPSYGLPSIYKVLDLNVTFQRPHNDFLWIISEFGFIGFNLFYGFVILILMSLLHLIKKLKEIKYIIVFSGISGYLFLSFFDFPKERIEINLLFYSLLAWSSYSISKEFPIRIIVKSLLSKFVIILILTVTLFISAISFLHFKGEYFTQLMLIERIKKNDKNVINLCNNAINFCYNIDATSIPIHWYKANALANLKNYKQALSNFIIAKHNHPYNHNVLNDLASAYVMNEKIDSAFYFYHLSASINPRFDDPKLNIIALYININDYVNAEKWNKLIFHKSERRDYYEYLIQLAKTQDQNDNIVVNQP